MKVYFNLDYLHRFDNDLSQQERRCIEERIIRPAYKRGQILDLFRDVTDFIAEAAAGEYEELLIASTYILTDPLRSYKEYGKLMKRFAEINPFKKVLLISDGNEYGTSYFGENVEIVYTDTLVSGLIIVNGKKGGFSPTPLNGFGRDYFFIEKLDDAEVQRLYPVIKESLREGIQASDEEYESAVNVYDVIIRDF